MAEQILTKTKNEIFVSVERASEIIFSHLNDYGSEVVNIDNCIGRVLAKSVAADCDFPPYNRITMDGIAINFDAFERGIREFNVINIQGAGDAITDINLLNECVEVMTGASLPPSTDTVVRYEDIELRNNSAVILKGNSKRGQNIHYHGSDKKTGEIILESKSIIDTSCVAILASTGNNNVSVKKLPAILIITTGNEIVEVTHTPNAFQIRNSNRYVIQSALKELNIKSATIHLSDDETEILNNLKNKIDKYDVIVLCGGVSKGKFDFIPKALEQLGVSRKFHQVMQRPGKPFWFGVYNDKPVFAFPGNPVSVFMCLYRYLIPWLQTSIGIIPKTYTAVLAEDFEFNPSLQYFLPVSLRNQSGIIKAHPVITNGSGDFINFSKADAFMELPAEQNIFSSGETFRIWSFKKII